MSNNERKLERAAYIKQCQVYLDYINEHVSNVQEAFNIYIKARNNVILESLIGLYTEDEILDAINACEKEVAHHDDSKFSDEEFEGYRKKWYPASEEKKKENEEAIEEEYRDAWEHHYLNNSHHPDYWLDAKGVPQDMDLKSILHMICDWEGMSIKFRSDTLKWYRTKAINDEQKKMSDHTKKVVEKILIALHPAKI